MVVVDSHGETVGEEPRLGVFREDVPDGAPIGVQSESDRQVRQRVIDSFDARNEIEEHLIVTSLLPRMSRRPPECTECVTYSDHADGGELLVEVVAEGREVDFAVADVPQGSIVQLQHECIEVLQGLLDVVKPVHGRHEVVDRQDDDLVDVESSVLVSQELACSRDEHSLVFVRERANDDGAFTHIANPLQSVHGESRSSCVFVRRRYWTPFVSWRQALECLAYEMAWS